LRYQSTERRRRWWWWWKKKNKKRQSEADHCPEEKEGRLTWREGRLAPAWRWR